VDAGDGDIGDSLIEAGRRAGVQWAGSRFIESA
jgi:hypothetical protein